MRKTFQRLFCNPFILGTASFSFFGQFACANSTDDAIAESLVDLHCANCHGEDLLGGPWAKSLRDSNWDHVRSAQDIYNVIRGGKIDAGMPGFAQSLSKAQIEELTRYIASMNRLELGSLNLDEAEPLSVALVQQEEIAASSGAPSFVNPRIRVRRGFKLEIIASPDFPPRFLAFDANGTLYASHYNKSEVLHGGRAQDFVSAYRDLDGDGFYETETSFVSEGLTKAYGVYHDDGWIWIGSWGRISKARDTTGDGVADEHIIVVPDAVAGRGHRWRSIFVHKGRVYSGIGDSGDVKTPSEEHPERQKIFSYALDGSDRQLFVSGIRNTERLVNRPGTDEIWGPDHGANGLWGERGSILQSRYPPDEINRLEVGGFYGHPFVLGHGIPHPKYKDRDDIEEWAQKTNHPMWCAPAHSAPNSIVFYDGNTFPKEMHGDLFVAYHGSYDPFNLPQRVGYSIVRMPLDAGKPYGELEIVSMLGPNEEVLGRPCDIVNSPDGSLVFSCDRPTGKHYIYKLSRANP